VEDLSEEAGIWIQRADRPQVLFGLEVYQLRSILDRFNSYERWQVKGASAQNGS